MKLKKLLVFLLTLVVMIGALPAFADEMPYYIEVDLSSQIVTVYRTSDGSIARQMLCSSGKHDWTPTGTFVMPRTRRKSERGEWYYFSTFDTYAKYASRIVDSILFHSLPYARDDDSTLGMSGVRAFGYPASHGCIRLLVEDAKFIAQNFLAGTTVKIYKSGDRNDDLRELLFESSYTGADGMSYDEYLGIPEDPTALGRFSSGSEVEDLQHRLRALGYFADEVNGRYGSSTVTAVKQIQKELGLSQTGIATQEFRERLYSADVPAAQNVPLEEGSSGPAVRRLQTDLQTLKLYDGEIDGVYDVDVIQAVQTFQSVYGYDAEAAAQPEVQKAVSYEAANVAQTFSGNYELTVTTESVDMVEVSAKTGIRVRARPTTDSDALGRVTDGMRLYFLSASSGWSQVTSGGKTGYIKNTFLDPVQQEIVSLTYSSADGTTYSFGQTVEGCRNGEALPCETFAEVLAAQETLSEQTAEEIQYATVNTQRDDVNLNLRQSPNSESEVLEALPNGTQLRVLLKSGDWSLVTDGAQQGYLMNEYLEFWTSTDNLIAVETPTQEDPTADDEDYEDMLYAVVNCSGGKAPVYDLDSEDANQIGELPGGTRLNVLRSDDEWSLIELEGHQGYMKNDVLEFSSVNES